MSHSDSEISQRLALALSAAEEAGRATLALFQQDQLEVERKADNSPVTIADRQAEQLLRGRIAAAFPHDAILGEEYGAQRGTSPYRWILDPIDGTKSFVRGVPLYGTMVGVERDGRSVVGVVCIPGLDESVYAAVGAGAWHRRGTAAPRLARVSSCPRLNEGLFLTSQIDLFAARGASEAFLLLQRAAAVTRTWGDCYGYLLVATGRAEVMVDANMCVWDAAALQPILEEAGGAFTDWQGCPSIHNGEGIGCNGLVLEEVLAVTRRFPKPQ
jgi:histidinol phosphatase-like enzyme (inositol monophosphatase family)